MMVRPAALFWCIILIGLAPFYDTVRMFVSRRGKAFVARSPHERRIRLLEFTVILVYLAVAFVWKWDFALSRFPKVAAWAGLLATLVGCVLASWSKIHLRRYFSLILGVQGNHQLITDGPYGRVRHPVYTGLLLALVGAALVHNSGATLVLLALPFSAFFYWQSEEEEKLFLEHFGEEYRCYRARTGRFLPRLISSE